MKIVVVGGGKLGSTVSAQLAKEGHDITLIDNNRDVVRRQTDALDSMVIYGNGASLNTQREADVENADLMIAVSPQDEINMMCCIIARKLGCENTIARVRNPEYAEQLRFLKDELGLSMSINPDWITAREIFRLTQIPGFVQRDSFARGRVEIVEYHLKADNRLCGVPLANLPRKLTSKMLVCAVKREGKVFIPDGNFILRGGDKAYITAPTSELSNLLGGIGGRRHSVKDIMIIGGSRIAEYLTDMLLEAHVNVKLIENNPARCRVLAEKFPGAVIINADGSSQATLVAENIEKMDSVVTLTNIDEENLIISIYASHLQVPQVITKINRTEYSDLFEDKGINCVVSPKSLSAQYIVRFVRAMQNTTGGSVLTVHSLVDNHVEALEFLVTEKTRNVNMPLKDINFAPGLLVSCINHDGNVRIPNGNDCFVPGDTVVTVTNNGKVYLDLNDTFA